MIKPNQTQPVIFPRCQVSTATISFPNIQWLTSFEIPELCFGTVTDYEYQLPANWKIGLSTSTGSNWIAGGNSVVVTSDLSTGNGADIRIRASNKTCGLGLAANGPVSTVRISRPGPTTITGGTPLLCSGTSTYTLNLIPPGASVSWVLTNPSVTVASIPIPSNGSSVTVTRVGTGNGNATLTANVSDCSGTYSPINYTIAVGTPGTVSLQVNNGAFDFCNTGYMQFDATLENPSPTTQLNWSVAGGGARVRFGAGGYTPVFTINRTGSFEIIGTITNGCGTSTYSSGVLSGADFWSNYCGTYRFAISTNPVRGNMNIVFDNPLKATENVMMRLFTLNSSILTKQWSLKGGQKQFSLNVADVKSGHYVLEIAIGKFKSSKQVIIE